MKTTHILKSFFALMVLLGSFASCTKQEPLIEELQIDREFMPTELEAFIRNQVNIELNWNTDDAVDTYLAEFSTSEDFSTIAESVTVNSDELPVLVPLQAETLYYIRVKAISSRGLDDSKYATITAETETEQIFLPQEAEDILATEATLRWVPNSTVTHITLQPGDIVHDITSEEMATGITVITDLTGETEYTAQIFNDTTVRGSTSFTTGIDIGDGLLVTPEDDLLQMIADAEPGATLVLDAGDYTAQTASVTLDKSITIRGLYSFDKPLLKIGFKLSTGASAVSLIDLDLTGNLEIDLKEVLVFDGAGSYESILISGCNIHDYDKALIYGNVTGAVLNSFTVENSVVTNVLTNGGDFIDFRNSDVLNINVNTSTFNNCAPARDFFRVDAAGDSNGTGLTCNINLANCTLYACSNSDKRIFYVRFADNDITSTNNLITDTEARGYSDNSATDETITFANNNYFNAPTFYDSSVKRYDDSTTYTTVDPGYADPVNGDFSVSTQSIIDYNIGDPRWHN
ncbi:DUF5123 domain-containing protein [Mangrovimonas sp. DI 80]|uniref:DUF5123 domain-containing protein n=1 Tax=Mangrovimonas sp. DI 80 TaxID=1779330 RepID=UPI000975AA6B|nr:DUF5123 domain-containing protein [Mangrovimonas sp. DI 80]OMP32369.1 hypothetical protein BKM32_04770 [Mangrovimonas sp. DI 80]